MLQYLISRYFFDDEFWWILWPITWSHPDGLESVGKRHQWLTCRNAAGCGMYEPGFWMFLGSLYASLQVGKHLNRRWIHPFVQDRPDATSQRSQKRSEDLPKVCYYSQSLLVTSKQGLICFWAEDTRHSSGLSGDMGMDVVNVYLMLSWVFLSHCSFCISLHC